MSLKEWFPEKKNFKNLKYMLKIFHAPILFLDSSFKLSSVIFYWSLLCVPL